MVGQPAATTSGSPRGAALGWALAVAGVTFTIQAFISRYLFWDSYFGLVAGRYIAANGVPTTEALTTAGKLQWIDQQWLSHWLFYAAWSIGGYSATALLSAVAVTLAFALLAALMVNHGVPGRRAFVWSLAALAVALGSTVVRAQSLILPLAVLLLWAILDDARRPGFRVRFVTVLPLLAIWANMHGSVLLGAGAVGAYSAVRAASDAWRQDLRSAALHAATGAMALAALLATPYGLSVFDYYQSLLANTAVHGYILEWSAPVIGNPYSLAFFAMLAVTAVVVGYGFARRYRPPIVLVVAAAGLGLLALTGVRYAIWFGIVAAVLNAQILAGARPAPPPFPAAFLRAGAAVLLAASVVSAAVLITTSGDEFERDLPRAAMAAVADYTAAHPATLILADELASALLWRHPGLAGHVGFDTRLEQYPEDRLVAWFEYLNGVPPGWPSATDGYDVLLGSAVDHPELVARLTALPGWSVLLAEPNGAAFVRGSP